jgi:hypothetical protein
LYSQVNTQIHQSHPSLGVIKEYLAEATGIVGKEDKVAHTMGLVILAEQVVIRDYRGHAPIDDSQFRAWEHDFVVEDDWVSHEAVPYIRAANAYVNSLMRP